MTWYSVLIEVGAEGLEPSDPRLDEMVDLTAEHAGVVGSGTDRWSVRLSVEAPEALKASAHAWSVVNRFAHKLDLPTVPVLRLEAVTEDELDADLERPNFPDLLGSTEITGLLDVSRQRLAELRRRPDFPQPMVELAAGPVWARAAVDAFLERWERKPGRPKVYQPSASGSGESSGRAKVTVPRAASASGMGTSKGTASARRSTGKAKTGRKTVKKAASKRFGDR